MSSFRLSTFSAALSAAAFSATLVLSCVEASGAQPLPKYSISGISSGGFMAAQMGVIHSDRISAVGTVAGGVPYCAGDHFPVRYNQTLSAGLLLVRLNDTLLRSPAAFVMKSVGQYLKELIRIAPENPTYQAVGVCMAQPELTHAQGADEPMNLEFVSAFRKEGLIADPANIASQRVFVYHGEKDDVIGVAMQERMREFYERFGVSRGNLALERGIGSHNFPTDRPPGPGGGIACNAESVPYLASCGNDVAGKILKHSLSRELSRGRFPRSNLYKISQKTALHTSSVAEYGYLAASKRCLEQPGRCGLHVALHGCKMSDSYDDAFQKAYEERIFSTMILHVTDEPVSIWPSPFELAGPLSITRKIPQLGALRFAMDSGYGEYAEANDLMILFPQTEITSANYPLNPKGCWDWFGWTQTEDVKSMGASAGRLYATNRGREARWLHDLAERVQTDPRALIRTWRGKSKDIEKARGL